MNFDGFFGGGGGGGGAGGHEIKSMGSVQKLT